LVLGSTSLSGASSFLGCHSPSDLSGKDWAKVGETGRQQQAASIGIGKTFMI